MRGKEYVCGKVTNQRGESIAEVLIALLVSSLGMLLLATMVSAAVKVTRKSKEAMGDYVRSESQLVAQEETGLTGTAAIKYADGSGCVLRDGGSSDIRVFYYRSDAAGNGYPVITYKAD